MEDKKQNWICIAIGLFLCFPSLNSAIGSITKFFFGAQFELGTYAIYAIYFLVMMYVLYKNIRRISISTFVITIFMLISFILSIVLNNVAQYVWTSFDDIMGNPIYLFLLYGFLGLYLAQYLKDMGLLCSYLDKFTLATIILALLQYIIALQSALSPQYMVFSYNLLFPTAYFSLRCMSNFGLKRLFGTAIGVGLILIAGCRGALVCYLIAILLYVIFSGGVLRIQKAVSILLLLLAIAGISTFWDEILGTAIKLLESMNIDSRTLTMLSNQSFFDDSGRSAIQETIMDNVGLLPKGLYYDRIVASGSYAHNLLLEVVIQYGILLGGTIIVWLCYNVIRSVFVVRKDPSASIVFYSLVSSGLMRLMFSSSYLLNEPGFWLLIGLILNFYNAKYANSSERSGKLCLKN